MLGDLASFPRIWDELLEITRKNAFHWVGVDFLDVQVNPSTGYTDVQRRALDLGMDRYVRGVGAMLLIRTVYVALDWMRVRQ